MIVLMVASAQATAVGVGEDAGDTRYVVGFRPGAADALDEILGAADARMVRASPEAGLALVTTDAAGATRLGTSTVVDFVQAEGDARASGAQWNGAEWNGAEWNGAEWNAAGSERDPGLGDQWGLARIRAPAAWDTTTGTRGTTLCIVDSGVDARHPDLRRNLWRDADGHVGWNAIDGSADVSDGGGHGTHVAGVAAAGVGNGVGIAGVGNVRIMSVKALDDSGHGREGDVAFGVLWCADHGADVVLLALSATGGQAALDRAIRYAAAADALVIASAGNGGPCTACVAYPASHPLTLAVAASTPEDALASFSARGPGVDVVAPGVGVLGTVPGAGYASASGTSQAAALAAGAAALVRDAHPGLDAPGTRVRLTATADATGVHPAHGSGIVDVARAIGNAGGD